MFRWQEVTVRLCEEGRTAGLTRSVGVDSPRPFDSSLSNSQADR
jgi:hypothetical protein